MITPTRISNVSLSERVGKIQTLNARIKAVNLPFTSNALDKLPVQYSNLADAKSPDIYKILHYSEQQKQIIEQTVGYIEFIAKAVSTVTAGIDFADGILKLMGLIPSPEDQFKKLYEALKAEIEKVQDAVVLQSNLNVMTAIDTSMAKAKSAAQAATAWVQQGKPTDNGVLHTSALQADTSSREAVNELMTKSRWLGLFDRNMFITAEKSPDSLNTGWGPWTIYASSHPYDSQHMFAGASIERMSEVVPREEGNYVWDYRLPLPALIFAISARLTVLQAHFPDFTTINQLYLDEISEISSFLNDVLKKIEDGIWVMPLDQWNQYSGLGPASCHLVSDVYTGQFVGGDKIQDMNFLTTHWGDNVTLYSLIISRYLSMLDLAHTPLLSAIANLSEIAKAKTNSSQPPVPKPSAPHTGFVFDPHVNTNIGKDIKTPLQHIDLSKIKLPPKK